MTFKIFENNVVSQEFPCHIYSYIQKTDCSWKLLNVVRKAIMGTLVSKEQGNQQSLNLLQAASSKAPGIWGLSLISGEKRQKGKEARKIKRLRSKNIFEITFQTTEDKNQSLVLQRLTDLEKVRVLEENLRRKMDQIFPQIWS